MRPNILALNRLRCVPTAPVAEQKVVLAGKDITVWSQRTDYCSRQPVIIFSHGFHGCATQSRFLMKVLASAGYLVFAPNHLDAICNGSEARWLGRPVLSYRWPERWNEDSYRNRADDIHHLIEAIRVDGRFGTMADLSLLGLVGHSLGGYTVLGLGGAWPSWKLEGVKAVLGLSPYSHPFVQHNTMEGLSAPVMYQGGTWDFAITRVLRKSMGSYDLSPEPKYYVEFERAGHFAWTDLRIVAHKAIVAYSLAFLNRYVKGEQAGPLLMQAQAIPGVAIFRYASEMGSSDMGKSGSQGQN